MPQRDQRGLTTGLAGVAGEYFVAAELSRRGYLATLTLRNTRGVDVLVANADASRPVGIQVKTNRGAAKRWMLNQKAEAFADDSFFYVFVSLEGGGGCPSYHVVPSAIVARHCRESHAEWLGQPGRGGAARRDTAMRSFADPAGEWRDRWEILGL
jgi:hypothetical protein